MSVITQQEDLIVASEDILFEPRAWHQQSMDKRWKVVDEIMQPSFSHPVRSHSLISRITGHMRPKKICFLTFLFAISLSAIGANPRQAEAGTQNRGPGNSVSEEIPDGANRSSIYRLDHLEGHLASWTAEDGKLHILYHGQYLYGDHGYLRQERPNPCIITAGRDFS